MRTILVPGDLPELDGWLEDRRRRGADLYDHEIGGVLRLNPAPRRRHGIVQSRLDRLLAPLAEAAGLGVGGPANLGAEGNFVVPDLVLLRAEDEPPDEEGAWLGVAALAIEILSPREDEAAKVADYGAVIAAGFLALTELWYVDARVGAVRVYDPSDGAVRAESVVLPPVSLIVDLLFSPGRA